MFREWFWRRKKRNAGAVVDLVKEQEFNDGVQNVVYGIYLHGSRIKVGGCDLRVGMNEELYYAGNIGYHVFPFYRGHGYAYEACRVLFGIALKEFDMHDLIITCSPENTPSRKTLEKLDGQLMEVAQVPPDHWLYRRGETVKNIYRYTL